jgi:hypothetical protein
VRVGMDESDSPWIARTLWPSAADLPADGGEPAAGQQEAYHRRADGGRLAEFNDGRYLN